MYAVVREYKMKNPQDIDKIAELARIGYVPLVSKASGFLSYTLALTEQGELVTTGFFEGRAGADESTRLAADWVRDNVAWAVEGPPKVTAGDVRVQERRGGEATYGGMRRGSLKPGKSNEAFELVRSRLLPLLSGIPGFVAFAALDVGPDKFFTLSAWRDRQSLQEATRRAMAFMQENAGDVMAGPPELIDAEIKVRHVNEAALQRT